MGIRILAIRFEIFGNVFLTEKRQTGILKIRDFITEQVNARKRRVHKRDIYRESGKLRTENGSLMEDGLGALGVSLW